MSHLMDLEQTLEIRTAIADLTAHLEQVEHTLARRVFAVTKAIIERCTNL